MIHKTAQLKYFRVKKINQIVHFNVKKCQINHIFRKIIKAAYKHKIKKRAKKKE